MSDLSLISLYITSVGADYHVSNPTHLLYATLQVIYCLIPVVVIEGSEL